MNKFIKLFFITLLVPTTLFAWDITNGTGVSIPINDQQNPQIISDGAGGSIVTWQDYRSTTGSPSQGADIYAQRINSAGSTLWTLNGVAICTATTDQLNPQIASDGSGGAIITWQDARSGDFDVYVQHVNSVGSTLWTDGGIDILFYLNDQINPSIISDNANGAIITWEDYGNVLSNPAAGADIYAHG